MLRGALFARNSLLRYHYPQRIQILRVDGKGLAAKEALCSLLQRLALSSSLSFYAYISYTLYNSSLTSWKIL